MKSEKITHLASNNTTWNCFGFLNVGGTFDRKDFLTVTLESCKIVLPLFTRVSFNQSTSNLTKALLSSNSCKSTIKNDRHFRFTRKHLARYRVVLLLGNKTLKSFKESVCVSRDNFQVLRQNCNSVSLYDTTWDKITNVLYSYRPNLQVKRREAGGNPGFTEMQSTSENEKKK